jgi:hypothetical protein
MSLRCWRRRGQGYRTNYSQTPLQRQRHPYNRSHPVLCRPFAFLTHFGKCNPIGHHRRHGSFAGAGRCTQAGGGSFRQFLCRQDALVGGTTPFTGCLRFGGGDGCCLRRTAGVALFSLEVMGGVLALRYVLPAIVTAAIATAIAWIALPDEPKYVIPAYTSSASALVWAMLAGPIVGLFSVRAATNAQCLL